tara:strand:- start:1491 stop:2702 length:1212 start_codon:yes stop_codon:yes gene_type:complete
MKQLSLCILFFVSNIIVAQNNDNAENRSKNNVKDSLMTNTYHLKSNQKQKEYSDGLPPSGFIEPVSKSNLFQDPNDPSTTWKDYERDGAGNIIYDKENDDNGKVRWQDAAYWSSREKQGMWEVAKLPYVSEDDVIWGTRVVRDIFLEDPANIPLKHPYNRKYDNHYVDGGSLKELSTNQIFSGIDARKNLFQILFDAAWSGQVNVYNSRMSRQYSEYEIKGDAEKLKPGVLRFRTVITDDGSDFEEDDEDLTTFVEEGPEVDVVLLEPFEARFVYKYRIVEDWFFDKRRSKMDARIVSITPYATFSNEEEQEEKASVGTFFYPEIRELLANHKIFNEQNMMTRMSFDEYFQRRLFSSVIIKESNVYDRSIKEYIDEKNKLAQLLEAERIKENIRMYESNAWEY